MYHLFEKEKKKLTDISNTNVKLKDLHMHLAYIIEHTREKENLFYVLRTNIIVTKKPDISTR
jgi:hypothetical protein